MCVCVCYGVQTTTYCEDEAPCIDAAVTAPGGSESATYEGDLDGGVGRLLQDSGLKLLSARYGRSFSVHTITLLASLGGVQLDSAFSASCFERCASSSDQGTSAPGSRCPIIDGLRV